MTTDQRQPRVVIIGAGMTGILLTIKLREAGIEPVAILEKADRLGGTWRENTYPGVACDVASHMYTYSFELNPNWSHIYAHGDEIQAYFEAVARKYGVTNSISFNEEAVQCDYNNGVWTVTTCQQRVLEADFIFNSTGILHRPAMPDIAGLNDFKGEMFHTARWNHKVNLRGKRVGVIGTGSTAAQCIPEVAKVAGHLSVFQRTPQWILPLGNREISEKRKQRYRNNPVRLHLRRRFNHWFMRQFTRAVTGEKLQNSLLTAACKLNLHFSIKDPILREKLRPDYRVGCKRVIVNNTFYPAIQRDNVELVTEGIAEITPNGVRTQDGRLQELDALILSTGFNPMAFMRPVVVKGRDGLDINEAWEKKIKTYRSVCLPGFPNNFLMLGPNTPIGNYSVIAMSEVQCAYLIKLIKRWQQREFDAIEPKAEAVERFGQYMREGLKKTVWVGGCQSWYMDDDGDPILWPYTWEQWEKEMAEPDMNDFELSEITE